MKSFLTAFFFILIIGCTSAPEPERINIIQALSSAEGTGCYEKASSPYDFVFPIDSGPHNTFKTEWWYYTGNLKTDTGRHFGYQLTFFRQALSCEKIKGASKWRTRQMYFAHFAVTDTKENNFISGFRMNRQSLDIAGADHTPYQVWIDNWRVEQKDGYLVLSAEEKEVLIRLRLTREKPILPQGQNGLSRKGKDRFNASYYYSIPRMSTRGTIKIKDNSYPVQGKTWFDHEWSTSALNANVAGWDWFSVHLEDGTDLMVCQIRNEKGVANSFGFGSISLPDKTYHILTESQFKITVTKFWKSPLTAKRYPIEWEVLLPDYDLSLTAEPTIQNQEHTHLFAYWEGAVQFTGKGIKGLGYVELTGY